MSAKTYDIVSLPGDGIGPEVVAQALRVLETLQRHAGDRYSFRISEKLFGGCAIDAEGNPLPEETLRACKAADAILLGAWILILPYDTYLQMMEGAVGGPKWGTGKVRPEQGILALRKALDLFANIRPAIFPADSLVDYSPLKPELARGTNIIVLRELVGGIYFGERQEGDVESDPKGALAWDRSDYSVPEIQRVARVAGHLALAANPPHAVHSIDKANVLATSRLWRTVVTQVFKEEFPQLSLDHHLVDSAAMLICSRPNKLNGILLSARSPGTLFMQALMLRAADNLFGDILSDETSVIPGSLGLLPSASLASLPDGKGKCLGIYEPIHGSAPDIAGKGIANPIGTILSVALMLRYSLSLDKEAKLVEEAVKNAIDVGHARSADLGGKMSTVQVGDAVLQALETLLK